MKAGARKKTVARKKTAAAKAAAAIREKKKAEKEKQVDDEEEAEDEQPSPMFNKYSCKAFPFLGICFIASMASKYALLVIAFRAAQKYFSVEVFNSLVTKLMQM